MGFIKRNKKGLLLGFVAFLIMGIVCLLLYEPMMELVKEPEQLKANLAEYGPLGMLIMALVMMLQVIFVFLPGEIIEVMAGFLYGPIGGMFVCLAGATLGSILIYFLVNKWGIRFIERFLGKEKLKEVSFLSHQDKLPYLLFIIFFIPGTPKDIITYFVPLTSIKLPQFLMITSVARIPSIITSTIGGNALGMQQYQFCIIVFVVTGLLSLVGMYFYKTKIHNRVPCKSNL